MVSEDKCLAVEKITINRKIVIRHKLYQHKDINTQLRIPKPYVVMGYTLLRENASNCVKMQGEFWSEFGVN